MRCHICNSVLSPAEVQPNNDHKDFDPCGRCLDIINDVFNDRTEKEIDDELLLDEEIAELGEHE